MTEYDSYVMSKRVYQGVVDKINIQDKIIDQMFKDINSLRDELGWCCYDSVDDYAQRRLHNS